MTGEEMTEYRTQLGRTGRAVRRLALSGLVAGFGLGMGVTGVAAKEGPNRDSYTFESIAWGTSSKDVRAALAKRGFRVVGSVRGNRREFVPVSLSGEYKNVDRGARLIAVGKFIGHPVIIELAFGNDDKLNTVIVKPRKWNKSSRDTQRIIKHTEEIVQFHEDKHGDAKKWRDAGWTDTAEWAPAKDGSRMQVFVRGVKGFTFSPSYDTHLRVRYTNNRYLDNKTVALQVLIRRPTIAVAPAGPKYRPVPKDPKKKFDDKFLDPNR